MQMIEKVAKRANELGVVVLSMDYLQHQNEGILLAEAEGNQFVVWGLYEDVVTHEASFHGGEYFPYGRWESREQAFLKARLEWDRRRVRFERWITVGL